MKKVKKPNRLCLDESPPRSHGLRGNAPPDALRPLTIPVKQAVSVEKSGRKGSNIPYPILVIHLSSPFIDAERRIRGSYGDRRNPINHCHFEGVRKADD